MGTTFLCSLPLGLSGIKIALHLLNFAILMGGMSFILYKPVLKHIKTRQDNIAKQLAENENNKKESEALLKDYKQKIKGVETEIDFKRSEAHDEIVAEREAILAAAQKNAEEIYKKAEDESVYERNLAASILQNEVAEVAVNIASNILEREISPEEHEKLIDACIEEWIEND